MNMYVMLNMQEVTLRRQTSDDRLGLTLYYRDTHTGSSDVIVGEVRPAYWHEYLYADRNHDDV